MVSSDRAMTMIVVMTPMKWAIIYLKSILVMISNSTISNAETALFAPQTPTERSNVGDETMTDS
jgi:hypothetical protein